MSTQSEKLTAIANAIRAKEGSSDPIPANDFPARIAAIETGVQLPELTNPATGNDVTFGKQYINQDGELATGGLYEAPGAASFDLTNYNYAETSEFVFQGQYPSNYADMIIRGGSRIAGSIPKTVFGNATAADVAAGKTFTSEAGVKVTGTGLLAQTLTAQITGPYMDTFEMVGPGGLVQRHRQAILEQTPIIVPGSVIFISILANSGQRYIPSSNPGFSDAYWVDNITDTMGYQMSYGAFIAQCGQTTYQINFTQR